jgi:hypothetical protein
MSRLRRPAEGAVVGQQFEVAQLGAGWGAWPYIETLYATFKDNRLGVRRLAPYLLHQSIFAALQRTEIDDAGRGSNPT